VSKACLILAILLCASPGVLLADGLLMHALVAGVAAVALAFVAWDLQAGEADLLSSLLWPWALVAAIPALWMIVQVLPLPPLAHPIWASAAQALGRPLQGSISVDRGASLIALGGYCSMAGVAFIAVAVSLDRYRAEWLLYALVAGCSGIALMLLARDLIFHGISLDAFTRAQAVDCSGLGAIISAVGCVRAIERYETRSSRSDRPKTSLLWVFALTATAFAICVFALVIDHTYRLVLALICGSLSLGGVLVIRRLTLGRWSALVIAGLIVVLAFFLWIGAPSSGSKNFALAFAGSPSGPLIGLSERVLGDAPLAGSGAGTFGALAPIYRDMDDPSPGPVAATAAAGIAIELGWPMFGLIAAAAAVFSFLLLRSSLTRGRDFYYPAIAGSCLIALLLLILCNAGPLGLTTKLIAAATFGLGWAQSKSRGAQP
jgi:hypothetical protein